METTKVMLSTDFLAVLADAAAAANVKGKAAYDYLIGERDFYLSRIMGERTETLQRAVSIAHGYIKGGNLKDDGYPTLDAFRAFYFKVPAVDPGDKFAIKAKNAWDHDMREGNKLIAAEKAAAKVAALIAEGKTDEADAIATATKSKDKPTSDGLLTAIGLNPDGTYRVGKNGAASKLQTVSADSKERDRFAHGVFKWYGMLTGQTLEILADMPESETKPTPEPARSPETVPTIGQQIAAFQTAGQGAVSAASATVKPTTKRPRRVKGSTVPDKAAA